MPVPKEIKELCELAPWPPEVDRPSGATMDQIDNAELQIGLIFPQTFREFLGYLNGPLIGPGGILGVGPDSFKPNICELLELFPTWKTRRWIPVAGDGCGNYYVLAVSDNGEGPVGFIDTIESTDKIAYVVASDFWHFLSFLLRRELGISGWPFSREEVLVEDPEISSCKIAPLPWEA